MGRMTIGFSSDLSKSAFTDGNVGRRLERLLELIVKDKILSIPSIFIILSIQAHRVYVREQVPE